MIIFNLFYLRFCFGPQFCIGNSSFGVSGFVPWRGGVRNIILLHTHTHTHIHTSYFFNTSPTLTLLTALASHTQHCHEPRNTYICWVLFQYTDMRFHFQCVFYDGGVENFYLVFGDRTRLSYKQTSQTADWEMNIQSDLITKLEQAVTLLKAILFQLLMAIYRPVCLFLHIKLQLEL
jgi:hypothetical protein